ncbi:hypothetical protein EV361DRAFT_873931 [Lentinula raphanica]|uniref:Uncharacterized protein n=1 Tax=Lentinula raphanica TaxID=153919 RepID=A0AA38P451_9AGAR|nr:hypothetical protein F5878DRAFT_644112 [Lentinula raphanica]KAJ3964532.1 hypothetical protein EV361DRAFT_873931 [Lentinula raphanica]
MNSPEDLKEVIEQLRQAFTSGIAPVHSFSTQTCCCQRDDCENYRGWQDMRSHLEEKITIMIGAVWLKPLEESLINVELDIGHALTRHYQDLVQQRTETEESNLPMGVEDNQVQISELIKRKQDLERQLNQASVLNDINEASLDKLHEELQEALKSIAHLSADNANFVEVMNERDDLRQELDVKSAKAKQTEPKLHAEVLRLQHELEQYTLQQMDFKRSLLQSAKAQIQRLYNKLSLTTASESTELTKSLEAVCIINEELKQHNEELKSLLVDARDELHALRQEVEEQTMMNFKMWLAPMTEMPSSTALMRYIRGHQALLH